MAAHSPVPTAFARLPWEVTAVMLAGTIDGYKQQERDLICEFKRLFGFLLNNSRLTEVDGETVHWVERCRPRKCVISSLFSVDFVLSNLYHVFQFQLNFFQ